MNDVPVIEMEVQPPDGPAFTLQVPSKRVARLLQLGIHAEREQARRVARRKAQRRARRLNRGG